MKTKRFLAFAYQDYYPSGGMNDCVGDFDTLDEAIQELNKEEQRFCQYKYVWDLELDEEVWSME